MFSGEDLAPPPNALFVPELLAGMKKGGVRRIIVPPELGYGPDGKNEIPPGKEFYLEVEIINAEAQ
jgi:FKBP-type peptidyl-prolyl cis-trans isomerase